MTHHSSSAADPSSVGRDSPYFEVIPAEDVTTALLLLCDHASNAIPERFQNLGLSSDRLTRHIAYDPGAGDVTRFLAKHFGATAILSQFSRLLVDPNRGEDDPTLVMRIADRAVIPGNRNVDDVERRARLAEFYRPYHDCIAKTIDEMIARGQQPVIISIHSFTETWRGVPRPWHFSILWDEDRRVAGPLLDALRQDGDLVVGDNEPYTGRLKGDTMWRHGTSRGLAHALVEVRQDLIRDRDGQHAAGLRLATALETALAKLESSRKPSGKTSGTPDTPAPEDPPQVHVAE